MLAAVHHGSATMPVTARLSQKFYERLGEDIANELVDWFNAVDATYRKDLRQLNELNFQRFDAKVEQRFAQADAKVEQRFAEFRVEIERRFAELRLEMEQRLAKVEAKLDDSVAQLREEIRTGLADRHTSTLKWMFGFWIATLVPLAGLTVGLFTLFQ
jgi:CRP-like cAMP-binding protein